MDRFLNALRAAAEPSRLRLLALCADGELTVTQLTQILGQSQPGVSRHLKLLCDAGLLERFREGSWVLYRLARSSPAEKLLSMVPADDPVLTRDRVKLTDIERAREQSVSAYFDRNAHQWDELRQFHGAAADVDTRLLSLIDGMEIADHLDIGTGTGQMLELFGPHVGRGIGIDRSRDMLEVARVNLDRAGLRNCSARLGDLYDLPFPAPCFDLVTLHQVLHYLDRPAEAIAEAARVLRPGGQVLVVDLAPHGLDQLRESHAHRRLGFPEKEMTGWLIRTGLTPTETLHLPGEQLTVSIWCAVSTPATAASLHYTPSELLSS